MALNNKDDFLSHRKLQEAKHFQNSADNPIKSILTVEVNTTELCNRKCVFCPRYNDEVYPNRNLHMTPSGAGLIADNLAKHHFEGKVSFSGFGENLLNPDFSRIVRSFKQRLPNAKLECNTNGDKLTKTVVEGLFDAGLDWLYINLYDGLEQIDIFDPMIVDHKDKTKYRAHYSEEDYGLFISNRSGTIDWLNIDEENISELQGSVCYYPFYKLFVDWNGDVLFCSNDWGKEHVVGNLLQQDLHDVWFSKPMRKIRNRLAKGDRSASPCDKCSVNGQLFGEKSFNIVQKYENSNNR